MLVIMGKQMTSFLKCKDCGHLSLAVEEYVLRYVLVYIHYLGIIVNAQRMCTRVMVVCLSVCLLPIY